MGPGSTSAGHDRVAAIVTQAFRGKVAGPDARTPPPFSSRAYLSCCGTWLHLKKHAATQFRDEVETAVANYL